MSNVPATIPENLPAYLQGADFGANDDASSNLSLGGFPYIKLNGTRFQAIEGDDEFNLPVLELPIVVMRAAPALRKKYFVTKFNPNSTEPAKMADCFSDDGVAPHVLSSTAQSKTCASCPHNAFGSGRDQEGKPTNGKACSDNKQLAVFSRAPAQAGAANNVFGLRLPPASLKSFAQYVKGLTAKRVPLPAALTIVGFDENFSFPVLTFRFGGLLDEAQYAAISKMAHGEQAETILAPTPGGHATQIAPAAAVVPLAAPVVEVAVPAPAADTGAIPFDMGLEEVPVAAQAASVVQTPVVAAQAAVPAAAAVGSDPLDDMFADLAAPAQATAPAPAQATAPAADMDLPDENDDDLAKELGLI